MTIFLEKIADKSPARGAVGLCRMRILTTAAAICFCSFLLTQNESSADMLQTNLTKQPNLLVPVGDLSGDDGKFVAGMLGKGGVEFGLGSSVFNMRSNSVSLNGTGISFMFPLALADALDLVTQFDVNYLNGSQAGSAVNISSSTLERNVIDGTTNLGGFNFVFGANLAARPVQSMRKNFTLVAGMNSAYTQLQSFTRYHVVTRVSNMSREYPAMDFHTQSDSLILGGQFGILDTFIMGKTIKVDPSLVLSVQYGSNVTKFTSGYREFETSVARIEAKVPAFTTVSLGLSIGYLPWGLNVNFQWQQTTSSSGNNPMINTAALNLILLLGE